MKHFIPQSDKIIVGAEKYVLIALSESAIDKKYQSKIYQVIEKLYDALNHEQEINK